MDAVFRCDRYLASSVVGAPQHAGTLFANLESLVQDQFLMAREDANVQVHLGHAAFALPVMEAEHRGAWFHHPGYFMPWLGAGIQKGCEKFREL